MPPARRSPNGQEPILEALPPSNAEAEATVIAALLVDADALEAVSGLLKPGDFFQVRHAQMFEAALELHQRGEAVNQVTIAHTLSRSGNLEAAGGHAYLSQIVLDLPTSVGIEHSAKIVQRDAIYRRLIDAAGSIIREAYQGGADAQGALERAYLSLRAVEESAPILDPTREEVLTEALEQLRRWTEAKGTVGVSTGFPSVDRWTDGLQPGKVWLVGALTSTGKTAWCVQVARHIVGMGLPVLYVSAEQRATDLWFRFVGAERGAMRGAHNEEGREVVADEIEAGLSRLAGLPFEAVNQPGMTVADVRRRITRRRQTGGWAAVFVDHVNLMRAPGKSPYEQISTISRELKALAMDCRVPIIAPVQLHRPSGLDRVDEWKMPPPTLRSLRESGRLEEDADVLILLSLKSAPDIHNASDLLCQVAKNRDGMTGRCDLVYARNRQQMWQPIEREE